MPLDFSDNIQKMDADISIVQRQLSVILYLPVLLLLRLFILLIHKNTLTFPHDFL